MNDFDRLLSDEMLYETVKQRVLDEIDPDVFLNYINEVLKDVLSDLSLDHKSWYDNNECIDIIEEVVKSLKNLQK